ncbi:putative BTB/POZ domain-containing protein [Helianthus debilis subsp. tardiflorus]
MTVYPPTATPLAPFIIHNFIIPLLIYTNKSIKHLTHKFKLFEIVSYTIVTSFLFFLKIIRSFLPFVLNYNSSPESESESDSDSSSYHWIPFLKGYGQSTDVGDIGSFEGDTCIARALYQLLAIHNEIPVSSRKYEVVRSYAEKLMDENLGVSCEPLRQVNATVLSGAFARALRQLEVAVAEGDCGEVDSGLDVVEKSGGGGGCCFGLSRVVRTAGYFGGAAWTRFVKRKTQLGGSAEKLAAELLWLAQKLSACGSGDEAVRQWASASNLASVSLTTQLRLQGSLVKLSVYLFKQAASMGGKDDDEGTMEELRKIKMKMLMSWIPFLCRSSNGTDAPILSFNEKAELENVLGELIGSLKHEDEQEKVLSLWLHHFTHCPSSDWPNLHLYYDHWCTTSRKLLILDGE